MNYSGRSSKMTLSYNLPIVDWPFSDFFVKLGRCCFELHYATVLGRCRL